MGLMLLSKIDPAVPGKQGQETSVVQTPQHLLGFVGVIIDKMGAEVPVVNLLMIPLAAGDESETLEQRAQRVDRRYSIPVANIPALIEFLDQKGADALRAADPGPCIGEA